MDHDNESDSDMRAVADEDWQVVLRFLPEGWKEQARATGAMRRVRTFQSAETLLRVLLVHLAEGCSLKETAARVSASGLVTISDVAIWKRLRCSGEWLRWMSVGLLRRQGHRRRSREWCGGYRVLLVDGTAISEPGSTGTDWRIHYSLELESLKCDHFELTDVQGGEMLSRFPVKKGDLLVGDRIYLAPGPVKRVQKHGGEVLLRYRLNSGSLMTPEGRRFSLLARARRLKMHEVGEWDVDLVSQQGGGVRLRMCAIKKSRQAAEQTRRKLRRQASKKCTTVSKETEEAAGYFLFVTTTDRQRLPAAKAAELYRARWQVELAFKRMKSIAGLGHLPKRDPDSARAWLHGKLFVALLTEALVDAPRSFFPWGYPIQASLGENG